MCCILYIGKEDKEYRNEYIKISSIGINQDGKSNGITAPNGPSQVKLLNRVKNNTDINKIDYIEAHGTGTSLGDPIEIRSICKVYSSSEDDIASVIGTSKSQVGHSESAAGLVALMKVIVCMKNDIMSKEINLKELNPYIGESLLESSNMVISNENIEWNSNRKTSSISSFGFTGTNSHCIIEYNRNNNTNYITSSFHIEESDLEKEQVLIISAKNSVSLNRLINKYSDFISNNINTKFQKCIL